MSNKTENRRINIYINGREVENNVKGIRGEWKRLNNEVNKTTLGTKEYNQKVKELKNTEAILDQHRNKLKGVNESWKMMKGVMIGVIGADILQRGLSFIPQYIQGQAELSDALADVRKTTGFTDEQLERFHKNLRGLNTRTATKELLDLARVGGKLGIVAEGDLLGFVRAADQINVALTRDLGGNAEEAIGTLGKLADIFKLTDEFGIEQALLKIGSAVNELGAASTANEAYIVDFTKRVGPLGEIANMTFAEVAGLAATLDSLGQSAEVSATVMNQLIPNILKDTAAYAEAANLDLKTFEATLQRSTTEGVLMFFEGLNKTGNGLKALSTKFDQLGIDGTRGVAVLSALTSNTETLRQQIELSNKAFAEGTSLTNEFNVKNSTLAANLDIIGRKLNALFVSGTLKKAIDGIAEGLANWLKVPLSDELSDNRIRLRELEVQLLATNEKSSDRIRILKALKEEYPQYFKDMHLEGMGLVELRDKMALVNKEMVNKIMIQRQQEKIDKQAMKTADEMQRLMDLETRFRKKMVEASEEMQLEIPKEKDLLTQLKVMRENLINGFENKSNVNNSTLMSWSNELNRMYERLEARQNRYNEQAKIGNDLDKEKLELIKRLSNEGTKYSRDEMIQAEEEWSAKQKILRAEELEAKKKAEAAKLQDELNAKKAKKAKNIIIESLNDARDPIQKEIDKLNKWFEEQMAKIAEAEAGASMEFGLPGAKAYKKTNDKGEAVNEVAKIYTESMKMVQDKLKAAMEEEEWAEPAIDGWSKEEWDAATAQRLADDAEFRKKKAEAADLAMEADFEKQLAHLQREEELARDSAAKKLELERQLAAELRGLRFDVANASIDLARLSYDIWRQYQDKKMADMDRLHSIELNKLAAKRDADLMSNEAYNYQAAKLEEQLNAKKNAIRKRQFRIEQGIQIAQSWMNTAQAVSQINANPTVNADVTQTLRTILTGLVAGIGIAQTTLIATQKPPEYRYGGVAGGPSHEQGGIDMIDSQTGRKVGEMEGGEPYMILSGNTYRNNKPIVDALLDSSMNRGGRPIDALFNNAPRFESGGVTMAAALGNDSNVGEQIRLLREDIRQWKGRIKADVYLNEFEAAQYEQKEIRRISSL